MIQQARKLPSRISRRRFAFWIGLGIFSVGEKLNAKGFDDLAAAAMKLMEPTVRPPLVPEHWSVAENSTWRWFERETLVDGEWQVTGITTPINKQTGEPYTGHTGYLDESRVPEHLRWGQPLERQYEPDVREATDDLDGDQEPGAPSAERRARHGRPPSKWLRSLHAEELRIWLKTIDVPEAGVSGMTFWEHLTRDHLFDAEKIDGLTDEEQAKLHAAAHYGY